MEEKIVVTCRYVSVLMSAILKAKGIPARCRAGFAPYFQEGVSMDRWVKFSMAMILRTALQRPLPGFTEARPWM